MKFIIFLLPLFFLVSCFPRIKTSNTSDEVSKYRNAKFEVTPIKKIELKGLYNAYSKNFGDDTYFFKKFQSDLQFKLDSKQIAKTTFCVIELPLIEIEETSARKSNRNVSVNNNLAGPGNKNANMPMLIDMFDEIPCCSIDLHYIVKSNDGSILLEGHALAKIGGGYTGHEDEMLAKTVDFVQKYFVSYLRGRMKSCYIQISKPGNISQ